MKRLMPAVSFLLLSYAPGPCAPLASGLSPQPGAEIPAATSITILFDNNQFDPRLKTVWGFSCLLRGLEKTIIFDTGGDGSILL